MERKFHIILKRKTCKQQGKPENETKKKVWPKNKFNSFIM